MISSMLATSGRFNVKESQIVPDDKSAIQKAVKDWSALGAGVDWIVTTGGTGFGVRDRTPEVSVLYSGA
jgi:gephyrin